MALDRPALQTMLADRDMTLLLMDGFDAAFIGWTSRINEPDVAVYDYDAMVRVCMWRDGMSDDEATEYIEFNCIGAWVGEQTPYILRRLNGEYA